MKVQDSLAKALGKRSFGYFGGKNYELGSGSGSRMGKKLAFEKVQP